MPTKIRILLVEDEPDHAKLIGYAFASQPEQVVLMVASCLSEARGYLADCTPDLVIADMLLPDGKGTDLLPGEPGAPGCPVVVVTGHGDEGSAVQAMKAGALDYVVKSETTLPDLPHIAKRALREWAYLEERKALVAQLLSHQERLRALASELSLAEQRERRRIAVGLHDGIAQDLAVLKMRLQGLRHGMAPPQLAAELKALIVTLDGTIEEVRTLTFELSPPILFEAGLGPAAEWLAEQFLERHGLAIELQGEDLLCAVDEDLRVTLFRALRELLVNVVKHGQTKSAEVVLADVGGRIRLTVSDRGAGFESAELDAQSGPSGRFGLLSIRERVEYFGGRTTILSEPGRGTTVTLSVPHQSGESRMP